MQAVETMKMPGTPTPSTPTGSTSSASRRPPRKSTLTQQQKNQKRQRATQDQLVTLEMEFNKNPTPTAMVRERIAQEINMTERSVQIWFQNRRAKIKNIAKKSIESGEDCNDIPDSMRRYLALQAMESGKSLGRDFLGRTSSGIANYGSGSMLLNTESSSSKVVIHHFACRSLSIGSWRRVGQSAMDLVIFYSPEKCCVTYYINNDSAGYKIEYPFSYIKNITLENGDVASNAEGAAQRPGGLIVELNRAPNFFMDSSGSGGFYQCGDFTEEQQASQMLVHHLGGHPKVLSGQLAKLVSLESFQNRHTAFENNAIAVSAPVSPVNHRPSSQPNHLTHPHFPTFQETPTSSFGPTLQPPRGHKRQRSRSVPVAIDFSMLRQPMQPFLIQESAPYMPPPDLFAPIPQHHSMQGPIGPSLSIDTSAGYGFEQRQPPMSATTANSPSEFGTPAFITSAQPNDTMPASNFQPTFNIPFLSPMGEAPTTSAPPVSPMAAHGDPVIANQSPPLSTMGRSNSAELFQMNHDSGMGDEAILSDLYAKQSLTLPFRSPLGDENIGDLDMQSLVTFDTIDPSSLSPENLSMH